MTPENKQRYDVLIDDLRTLDLGTAANVFCNAVNEIGAETALVYLLGIENMALHVGHPDAWKLHHLRQEIKWLLR